MLDDSLTIVEDNVFKLDADFDLLADSTTIHILHAKGFEYVAELQHAVLDAVPENIAHIQRALRYVSLGAIAEYATKHPRAARLIASIRDQPSNIDRRALKRLCDATGVEISNANGQIVVGPGSELGFLEVLDRRRYEVGLVVESPEQYRAGSRTKIKR